MQYATDGAIEQGEEASRQRPVKWVDDEKEAPHRIERRRTGRCHELVKGSLVVAPLVVEEATGI